ncbi:hypothetical protein HAX54_039138 [Datura stramonium]|uniref:Uncharacterized protein n=1 Tax=Datura stramonium TaxID=4076 RepID=A0ABS8RN15_DATST|nr:hypothetical protein [Datura stramonium]
MIEAKRSEDVLMVQETAAKFRLLLTIAQKTEVSSKVSALFSGTQDKCAACKKTVYPLEKVTVDGRNVPIYASSVYMEGVNLQHHHMQHFGWRSLLQTGFSNCSKKRFL